MSKRREGGEELGRERREGGGEGREEGRERREGEKGGGGGRGGGGGGRYICGIRGNWYVCCAGLDGPFRMNEEQQYHISNAQESL